MSDESSDEAEFTGDSPVQNGEKNGGHESSSEEDEPLSALGKRAARISYAEDDNGDEGDEDEPLSTLGKRAARISYAEDNNDDEDEDDDSDDDEDDIPLAALVQKSPPPKKKKKSSTTNGNTKKAMKTAKKAPNKKRKPAPKAAAASSNKTSNNSSKTYEWASAALYGSQCTKGLLIQRLLCRWWYAITWPDPTSLPVQPPQYYDSLDGFPGVYVCTSQGGDAAVGHLLDLRDKSQTPSFGHFCQKTSQELQQLLLKALQEQKKALVEAEGSGTSTEKEIDQLIKWTQKVAPAKADKEAAKVLKAYNLRLPATDE